VVLPSDHPDVRADLEENGISAVEEGADAVVVGDAGGGLTYDRLNRAFRLLMEGLTLSPSRKTVTGWGEMD